MGWSAALPKEVFMQDVSGALLTFVVPAPGGCDLACPFCYIKQRGEDATVTTLSPIDYTRFIIDASNSGPLRAICIQGYEPLLPTSFNYTMEILAAGQRLGVPTSLVTNGTHLRQSVPTLSKLRPAHVAVSLDSASAASHDRMRGREGAFADALKGIKFATNVPRLKQVLVIMSVLLPKKVDRLIAMPRLLSDLGIQNWVINALVKVGKDNKLGGPAGERHAVLDDLLVLKAEADRYGIEMVVDDEFGRLSEDDYARELMEVEALRIKRLVQPEGVYRLVPTGHCSKGAEILKPIHDNTPVWDPKTDAGEFIASLSAAPTGLT